MTVFDVAIWLKYSKTQKKSTWAIALADESISNNNLTIDELVKTAYNVIDSWRQ